MNRRNFIKMCAGGLLLPVVPAIADSKLRVTSGISEFIPKTAEELYVAMNKLIPSVGYISSKAYEVDSSGIHIHKTYALGTYNTSETEAEKDLVLFMWRSFQNQALGATENSRLYWRRVPEFSMKTHEKDFSIAENKYKLTMRYSISNLKHDHNITEKQQEASIKGI